MTTPLPIPTVGPVRVRRRRTAGWRMPIGAVYVGRPTRWGNPYAIAAHGVAGAVARYRAALLSDPTRVEAVRTTLAGRDLACWCPLDRPCHADVLLTVANPTNVCPDTAARTGEPPGDEWTALGDDGEEWSR